MFLNSRNPNFYSTIGTVNLTPVTFLDVPCSTQIQQLIPVRSDKFGIFMALEPEINHFLSFAPLSQVRVYLRVE